MADKASTKVLTPRALLSYPHLHNPQAAEEGKKAKYSCALIFPAGTDLSALMAAAIEAARGKFGDSFTLPNGTKIPVAEALAKNILKNPFRRDVEAKGYPEGAVFINVRTEQKPGCVYAHAGEDGVHPARIPAEKIAEELYPGCFVRASVAAFGYDNSGNRGVSFALNNIQKLAEGERLDGRVAAENEFDADLSKPPADISSLF